MFQSEIGKMTIDFSDLFRDEPVVMYSKDGTEMVFVSEAGYKAMMKKEN